MAVYGDLLLEAWMNPGKVYYLIYPQVFDFLTVDSDAVILVMYFVIE